MGMRLKLGTKLNQVDIHSFNKMSVRTLDIGVASSPKASARVSVGPVTRKLVLYSSILQSLASLS